MFDIINFDSCVNFINSLDSANKQGIYLIPDVPKEKFLSSPIKPVNFKTAQIAMTALKCCDLLKNDSAENLSERVKLLTILDSSLTSLATRICNSIQQRWYFPILKFFGYQSKCPKYFTEVTNSINSALATLKNLEAEIIQKDLEAELIRKREQANKLQAIFKEVPCSIHFSEGITKIEDAQIILLGENHVDKRHSKLENELINELFRPGDVVLLEGLSKDQAIDPANTGLQKTGLHFRSDVSIEGWEDINTYNLEGDETGKMVALILSHTPSHSTVPIMDQQTYEQIMDLSKGLDQLCLKRSHYMIDKIKSMVEGAGRVFVIAGADHMMSSELNFNALNYLKNYKCALIMPELSPMPREKVLDHFRKATSLDAFVSALETQSSVLAT